MSAAAALLVQMARDSGRAVVTEMAFDPDQRLNPGKLIPSDRLKITLIEHARA